MKKWHKIFLICVLLAGALFLIYRMNTGQDGRSGNSSNLEKVVVQLQSLDIKNKDLSEERKKYYQDEFERFRKSLDAGLEFMKQQNNEGSRAALYWPAVNLGHINRDVGDYAKAEKAYLFAHELQPNAFVPLGDLGELYARYLKDYKRGAEYYEQAVLIDNPYLDTYYSELYQIYRFQLNDEKRAERTLIDGVKKYPAATNILAELALYYRQTGQVEKAISRYNELLAKKPDSEVAKKALEELQG